MEKTNLNDLINLYEKFKGDLEETQKTLKEILEIHAHLINVIYDAKVEFPSWKVYFETLINKMIFNSYSILELSKGFGIKAFNKPVSAEVVDYASIFVLTRSLIENYLTLNIYIFLNDLPEEVKFFRFKLWEVSGLITRQNFGERTDKKFNEKLALEKETIEKIKLELLSMPEFHNLDKRRLNSLDKYGLPRLESWHTLIDQSGLNKVTYSPLYSLTSSYSHSEYLSIIQFRESTFHANNEGLKSQVRLSLHVASSLNSLVIDWLKVNFKSVEIIYNSIPRASRLAIELAMMFSTNKEFD